MGLLSLGSPLSWDETAKVAQYVRQHGIEQFINNFNRVKDRQGDVLRWGDEIEYMLVKFDHDKRRVQVSLRGAEILKTLMAKEDKVDPTNNEFLWRPEYAAYMLEGTPGMPYGGELACFNVVEANMVRRREEAQALCGPNESVISIGNFPRLGCANFTDPPTQPNFGQGITASRFFPDVAIYGAHPRFRTLTKNIRERRGERVAINVPIFKDSKTPRPFREPFFAEEPAAKDDHIYMDAMGFGMGCCCLQVTFQAVNVNEARWLYDQLTPITPILMALSASTPIFRGFLADVDSRWDVISASVDDRTKEERGLEPLRHQQFVIPKSRYDTTDCYLYPCSDPYNDLELLYDEKHYQRLIEGGIDPMLAKHIAHLFIRDPIQVYEERLNLDDQVETEHFETIQSSNWQNMRFKPPPADAPHIGWRVEFRPTEVQLTDFENAAYVIFVVLLTRVMISFRLSVLIPISKVNENMKRAQKRDAVLTEKFYFRKGVSTCDSPPETQKVCGPCGVHKGTPPGSARPGLQADYEEMSIAEIINGNDSFPGLVPLIFQYLDSVDVDVDTRCSIQQYLKFIQRRATGEIMTLARWMREFVKLHAAYKQDSVVGEETVYDMMMAMNRLQKGELHCPKLLGSFKTKTKPAERKVSNADPGGKEYKEANGTQNGSVVMENGEI